MLIRDYLRCCFAFLALSLLPSCSGDAPDPAPAAAGSSGAQAPAPLKGKDLGKASQLVGVWFATSRDVDFECLEFMKDGKAILGDGSAGVTVDYSVLDGGRLSLVAPGGMTTVFAATITSDQLELSGAGSVLLSGGTHRYRRLAAGESCDDARKVAVKARADAYRKRVESLEAFLKQPGLVLAFAQTAPGAPASIALAVTSTASQFTGQAWHDDQPPHLNAISGQLQFNEAANAASVLVNFGPRIAPPATQPDGGGQISMSVEGDGKDLRISSKVTFGGGGPAHEMVLRSDPKLHAEIVKRYEAELVAIEAIKQPLLAMLKDYAELRGQLQSMDQRTTEVDTTKLTLVRDPKTGQYTCEGIFVGPRGRGELVTPAAAEIAVANKKPLLRIVCPGREYLLELPDAKAMKLSGQWSGPGVEARGAQFEVTESLDAAARDAKFETLRKALRALAADSVFTGLAFEDSRSGMEMPIPFRLQITLQPDGKVAGVGEYPTLETRMTLAGQLVESSMGPRLQLNFTAVESTPGNKIFLRSIQNGAWQLTPEAGAGPLQLTGHFTGPPVRTTTLTLVNADSTARLRKHLTDVMGQGGRFYVAKFVGWQQAGQTPTVVEWQFDAATDKLTGRKLVDGRHLGTNEKMVTSYAGDLKSEHGWNTFEVMQVSPFHTYDRAVGALKLYVAEDVRGVLHLNGAMINMGQVPNDKPLPAFPATMERLIGLIPVADTDAATHAAIDKAIADVEAAHDAADAATKAAQSAAIDARRAKLAPYFPMFLAQATLVITTDAPAAMGSVIIESQVDEASATIRGNGLDLRAMPFREFTFESGVDNYGNLTITTSLSATPLAFAAPKDNVAAGRGVALKLLPDAERAKLDATIALGKRLQSAAQTVLTVEILDPPTAKTREASLAAVGMPGNALYKNARNDQVSAMFTPQSNGRYRWTKEPVTHRLNEPMTGKAIYIKNGAPTDNLVVIINGVHRATIAAIAQHGAAIISLPPDLEILDLRLQAEGTAQARGVVLLN
ncbi:MAG: hypothetical protein ACKVX7_08985 [Planctomycetota bacterium]